MAHKKLSMSEEAKIAADIRSKGVSYLLDAARDPKMFQRLQASLSAPAVRTALIQVLRAEGKRLLEAYKKDHKKNKTPIQDAPKKFHSPIRDILADPKMRDRLRELMMSANGRKVVKSVTGTTEGEFLVVGYLFNAPGGPILAGGMFVKVEGLKTVKAILDAACTVQVDPQFVPKLPPFKPTREGERFRMQLSSESGVNGLIAELITFARQKTLQEQFQRYPTEMRSILRDVLSTDAGVNRVYKLMMSPQGREFLEMLGEVKIKGKPLGMVIAGDDLWLTKGGRKLVRKLLETTDGIRAVVALVSGFY